MDKDENDVDTIVITGDSTSADLNGVNLDGLNYQIDMSSLTIPSWTSGNVTIDTSGSSGSYIYTNSGINGTWGTINSSLTSANSSGLHVSGTAEFEGDVKIRGRSLEKMLQKIEDRLAIIQDPDPAKLEKYAALKKAYEHYKTLERLIGDD